MSESKYLLCRLCKGTDFLRNFYDTEGDTSLVEKTRQCIGLQICRNDGLPSMICKFCERMLNKFYIFKQKCLKVNSELLNKDVESLLKNEDSIKIKAVLSDKIDTESLGIVFLRRKHKKNNTRLCYSEENIKQIPSKVPIKIENCNEPTTSVPDELMEQDEMDSSEENTEYKISGVKKKKHVFNITLKSNKNNNKDEHPPSSFQCEHCGSIYKTRTEYRAHLASHKEPRLHKCKLCNKHFTRADSLNVHMRSHSGIRPFVCEICGRSSTKKQDLIRHMKIHSDEKKYECPTCGRKFKWSTGLQVHSRTHTGARPYKCQNCDKSYKSHSALRKHTKSNICKELDTKSANSVI